MTSQTLAVSYDFSKCDHRCSGWAIVVHANDHLPLPDAITGATSIGLKYLKQTGTSQTIELFEGDYCLQGEANHHKKSRGWSYWLGANIGGEKVNVSFDSEFKAALKLAMAKRIVDMPLAVLKGSGDVAAMIRRIHADRAGFLKAATKWAADAKAEEESRAALKAAVETADAERKADEAAAVAIALDAAELAALIDLSEAA